MSLQDIQNGIAAAQQGNYRTADQLLRQGLHSEEVVGNVRAVALMWLATTNPSIEFKIQCYQAALQADPYNADVKTGLGELIASQTPPPNQYQAPPPSTSPPLSAAPRDPFAVGGGNAPPPPPTSPEISTTAQKVPRLWEFGIRGGPNGVGTGFLIVRDGLVATSRFVVGTTTRVILETRDGRELDGAVVRSYPELDLAFIKIRLRVSTLRDTSPSAMVLPGTPLIADDYTERKIHGQCRETLEVPTEGWFPTTFSDRLPGAFTGAPILDDEEDVVGMLTRNATRNGGQLFGLHISVIRRKFEEYYTETRRDPERLYCGTCGNLSKAGEAGLFYCEACGALFPFAQKLHRTPHPQA
ncbi:MAG: serine protease, partial [Chloroflexota bacterium]